LNSKEPPVTQIIRLLKAMQNGLINRKAVKIVKNVSIISLSLPNTVYGQLTFGIGRPRGGPQIEQVTLIDCKAIVIVATQMFERRMTYAPRGISLSSDDYTPH
jgi:hypothetical protein